ncbi:Rieske 2Fe-2S domain-containing protein [Pseudomonas aeruginosa]|uniref:Rieske (2Fe-2S) protein n=1 Tax=Pseudomonas aeruginosa TaxID=287 RepID=UPI0021E11C13|nr:Rieske 2Fe-2S domain-containing protein [Pseudomonas aeruginosa]MCV0280480.1 Rieske 2Fe-2S domain-containing protein [Pseudomonas aeruginosa]
MSSGLGSASFLCREDELLEGQARGFDPWLQGRDTVVALRWRGLVRVYRNSCPHWQVPMQYRKDRFMSGDGRYIVCFAHGALFQPENGFCLQGPCLGQSLQSLGVSDDGEGGLWVVDE